jgi:hypothetical protein
VAEEAKPGLAVRNAGNLVMIFVRRNLYSRSDGCYQMTEGRLVIKPMTVCGEALEKSGVRELLEMAPSPGRVCRSHGYSDVGLDGMMLLPPLAD